MKKVFIFLCALFGAHAVDKPFPADFKFGVATASYQIEGGWNASGKGENIWDRLTHEHPELVKDRSNGDIACDSYHKWKEDVVLLKTLGVHFYRFSLSWSRILPTGYPNKINPDGIRYYNNLIDELIKNKIEPVVTIYHWDLPQPLQEIGGWPNILIADYFEDYANVVFKYFGDRVKTWITINEPPEVCSSGYSDANNAPRGNAPGIGEYQCGRTLLLAHARAYRLYNNVYRKSQKGKVGITINAIWSEPKTNSFEDIQAANRHMLMDLGWWANPIFSPLGNYPDIFINRIVNISKAENFTRSRLPLFTKEEVKLIQGTSDFFGLNHYSTWLTENKEYPINSPPSHEKDKGTADSQDPSWKPSSLPWLKVVPWGFRKLLNWIKTHYNNPIVYITENGFADTGDMNDVGRIEYYQGYLNAVADAINLDKCNVKAYTAWSLMDNMEWREGYTAKFGLYQVDFNSPNRTRKAKASAKFYQTVVKNMKVPATFYEKTYQQFVNTKIAQESYLGLEEPTVILYN